MHGSCRVLRYLVFFVGRWLGGGLGEDKLDICVETMKVPDRQSIIILIGGLVCRCGWSWSYGLV